MEERFERYWPDMDALHRKFRTQPCFVCRLVAGDRDMPRYVFHEDDESVAFLDGYPRAYGYSLVAPREHREQVTGDFHAGRVPRPAAARLPGLRGRAPGGRRGADVPLHLRLQRGQRPRPLARRPLPPGVPYEEQQGAWAGWDSGVLKIPQEEMAALAARISARLG